MANKLPPLPPGAQPGGFAWNDWYEKLRTQLNSLLSGVSWTLISGTPTTLSGYGITDAQKGIQFKDEGSNLGASGTVDSIDFTGSGVTATRSTNALTVNITGGGGGTSLTYTSGTDANTTMAVNTVYIVDLSTFTADRTYTLPSTAAVGDEVQIILTSSNASYELLITANTGDTLNGVAGGTEWSRLFISGESITARCVVANATWIVEKDNRIPQQCLLSLTTSATGEAANTFVRPTSQGGAWTSFTDNASIGTTSNGQIKTRRAGSFDLTCFGFSVSTLGASKYFSVALYKNGTTNILFASSLATPSGLTIGQQAGAAAGVYTLVADDYVVYQYRSEEGSKGLNSTSSPRVISWFSLQEIL